MVPPSCAASSSASADLPLAVGPAMRMALGVLTSTDLAQFVCFIYTANRFHGGAKCARPSPFHPAQRPVADDQALPSAAPRARPRRRNSGAALRRAVE